MAKNFVIYESRNRLTGTLMRTLDLRHNECPPQVKKAAEKEMPGARYAAMCVEHAATTLFEEHYPAGRAIAHPDEWCAGCQAHLKAEKPKVTAATSEAYMKEFRAAAKAADEKTIARKAAAEARKAAKLAAKSAPVVPAEEVTPPELATV